MGQKGTEPFHQANSIGEVDGYDIEAGHDVLLAEFVLLDLVVERDPVDLQHLGSPCDIPAGAFEYELDLYSRNESINIDDILGQNVTIYLDLPDGSTRHLNGFVSRFSQIGRSEGGFATYEAILRPWLWFLTRTRDCRIFQEKTVSDIIKEIFGDHGFSDYEEKLNESYRTREYCVQYRETDFNFVSRLMEEENIYYFFTHEAGKHTLVLCDNYGSHAPLEAINP